MGFVCIAAAILLREALFQSDGHLGIQRVYVDIVFWLPVAALLVSLLSFLNLVLTNQLKSMQTSDYISWCCHSLGFSWSCRCSTYRSDFHIY